jgi:hypothetical protein
MHAKYPGWLTAMHSGRLTAVHSGRRNGSKILLSVQYKLELPTCSLAPGSLAESAIRVAMTTTLNTLCSEGTMVLSAR